MVWELGQERCRRRFVAEAIAGATRSALDCGRWPRSQSVGSARAGAGALLSASAWICVPSTVTEPRFRKREQAERIGAARTVYDDAGFARPCVVANERREARAG